jgi:hypothetical protein
MRLLETGILATMPCIALQLLRMQVRTAGLGLGKNELYLVIAFVIPALYSYKNKSAWNATLLAA